ncbi:unnamed protein product [Gadus morhua 'NCC']
MGNQRSSLMVSEVTQPWCCSSPTLMALGGGVRVEDEAPRFEEKLFISLGFYGLQLQKLATRGVASTSQPVYGPALDLELQNNTVWVGPDQAATVCLQPCSSSEVSRWEQRSAFSSLWRRSLPARVQNTSVNPEQPLIASLMLGGDKPADEIHAPPSAMSLVRWWC